MASIGVGIGTSESYLRIASLSIYVYDILITIPREYRFYRRHKKWWRPNVVTLAFVGCRYFTLVFLCWSQGLYFTHNFPEAPSKRLSPLIGAQSLCSCLIFIWRTSRIWSDKLWPKVLMWISVLAAVGISITLTVESIPRSLPIVNNCILSASPVVPAFLPWLFYMVFDLICFALVFIKLRQQMGSVQTWKGLAHLLYADSLRYIAGATILNGANLVFFALPPRLLLTTTLSSLSAAFISILSQRIVFSLHEFKRDNKSYDTVTKRAPVVRAPKRKPSDAHLSSPRVANLPVLLQRDVLVEIESGCDDDPATWRADITAIGSVPPRTTKDVSPVLPPFLAAESLVKD